MVKQNIFLLNTRTNKGQQYGSIAALLLDYAHLSKSTLYKKSSANIDKSKPFYEKGDFVIWKMRVKTKPKST